MKQRVSLLSLCRSSSVLASSRQPDHGSMCALTWRTLAIAAATAAVAAAAELTQIWQDAHKRHGHQQHPSQRPVFLPASQGGQKKKADGG